MGVVDDLLAIKGGLAKLRAPFEPEWQEIADLAIPAASRGMRIARSGSAAVDAVTDQPSSRIGARKRFESMPMRLGGLLASGMESLTTPQSEQWHGYAAESLFGGEAGDDATEYFERLARYTFAARYDARSGFVTANQKAIKSAVFFGTGVCLIEDYPAGGAALPWRYRFIPISQSLLANNERDEVDTNFRVVSLSARLIMQSPVYAKSASARVKEAASKPSTQDQKFEIVHAVMPRGEIGSLKNARRRSSFCSYVFETETKTILEESGYDEFPYLVYHWEASEEGPYGEGAIGLAIDDIRSLNFARKQSGSSVAMALRPPMAIAHDGVMNRPNLNPGAVNYAGVDGAGRPRILPLLQPPDIGAIQAVMQDERNQLKVALMSDLFSTQTDNPQMTATEALIKKDEKGDLLGPVGLRLQAALARANEREVAILSRIGAFEPDSALAPPPSLEGKRFAVKWTSPIDRLRLSKAVMGTQRLLEFAAPVLQNEGVLSSRFDIDDLIETAREGFGAPKSVLLSEDEREEAKAAAAQQAQAAQMAAAAPGVAKAAKDGADAAQTAGLLPPPQQAAA